MPVTRDVCLIETRNVVYVPFISAFCAYLQFPCDLLVHLSQIPWEAATDIRKGGETRKCAVAWIFKDAFTYLCLLALRNTHLTFSDFASSSPCSVSFPKWVLRVWGTQAFCCDRTCAKPPGGRGRSCHAPSCVLVWELGVTPLRTHECARRSEGHVLFQIHVYQIQAQSRCDGSPLRGEKQRSAGEGSIQALPLAAGPQERCSSSPPAGPGPEAVTCTCACGPGRWCPWLGDPSFESLSPPSASGAAVFLGICREREIPCPLGAGAMRGRATTQEVTASVFSGDSLLALRAH